MKCWVCESKMYYEKDTEMECLGWYRFKCPECGEGVLTPQRNPMLKKEDFEPREEK